jgi:hypothetical protein
MLSTAVTHYPYLSSSVVVIPGAYSKDILATGHDWYKLFGGKSYTRYAHFFLLGDGLYLAKQNPQDGSVTLRAFKLSGPEGSVQIVRCRIDGCRQRCYEAAQARRLGHPPSARVAAGLAAEASRNLEIGEQLVSFLLSLAQVGDSSDIRWLTISNRMEELANDIARRCKSLRQYAG